MSPFGSPEPPKLHTLIINVITILDNNNLPSYNHKISKVLSGTGDGSSFQNQSQSETHLFQVWNEEPSPVPP